MRPLTTTELLDIWEHSRNQNFLDKSLYLLTVACSININTVRKLSIGERDARLFQLREWLFGSYLNNIAACPLCHQQVEWENKVSDFQLQKMQAEPSVTVYELEKDGYYIRFRLPNSDDITKALYSNNQAYAQKELLQDCLLEIQFNNTNFDVANLPDHLSEIIVRRMADEDPQADIRINLHCPDCKHNWDDCFDIMSYFWTEINTWALRILHDVHLLAKAFHWSEQTILQMSPYRRNLYLEMIR